MTRRKPGRCEDCGQWRPVRTVTFWLNGHTMRLCARCERPYRGRLTIPTTKGTTPCSS